MSGLVHTNATLSTINDVEIPVVSACREILTVLLLLSMVLKDVTLGPLFVFFFITLLSKNFNKFKSRMNSCQAKDVLHLRQQALPASVVVKYKLNF